MKRCLHPWNTDCEYLNLPSRVKHSMPIFFDIEHKEEFTIEANPGISLDFVHNHLTMEQVFRQSRGEGLLGFVEHEIHYNMNKRNMEGRANMKMAFEATHLDKENYHSNKDKKYLNGKYNPKMRTTEKLERDKREEDAERRVRALKNKNRDIKGINDVDYND